MDGGRKQVSQSHFPPLHVLASSVIDQWARCALFVSERHTVGITIACCSLTAGSMPWQVGGGGWGGRPWFHTDFRILLRACTDAVDCLEEDGHVDSLPVPEDTLALPSSLVCFITVFRLHTSHLSP